MEYAINFDQSVVFHKALNTLRDIVNVQSSSGNYDYSPYMHGMANGMIFALSLFGDKEPEYLDAPYVWLCDIANTEKPVVNDAEKN